MALSPLPSEEPRVTPCGVRTPGHAVWRPRRTPAVSMRWDLGHDTSRHDDIDCGGPFPAGGPVRVPRWRAVATPGRDVVTERLLDYASPPRRQARNPQNAAFYGLARERYDRSPR